jgi:hypothetical protein
MLLTVLVFIGVLHHLTLSPHGPELLKPLVEKYFAEQRTAVLDEAARIQDLEIHRHFHNIVDFPKLPENERPVCYICHSDYPHVKNKKIRSLLNMHTQYFVCETCHIKAGEQATVVHKWYNPVKIDPAGPFFGTRYDPDTGHLAKVDDLLSKIAPYFKKDGQLDPAIQLQDAPLAREYVNVRDRLTPEQRDVYKMKFHGNIQPKGYECANCHSPKGVLDFKALGFSEKRTADLQYLNIKGMITKYEVFHLPELFK